MTLPRDPSKHAAYRENQRQKRLGRKASLQSRINQSLAQKGKLIPNLWKCPVKSFWEKVVKSDNPNDCWEWIGGKTKSGYGGHAAYRKFISAHRFSYMINNGAIPKKYVVMHLCNNKSCVNPSHLVIGVSKDNSAHMVQCGHSLVGEKHFNAKLTDKKVLEIRKKYVKNVYSIPMLAREYGIDKKNVWLIVNNKTWKHI